MKRSRLVLISIVGVVVVGIGVGLWFAFAGPKDKDTTTTTITCKKGTDDCRVEGDDAPKNNHVGPDAPDPTETLPGGDDPWKKDQQQLDIPWANYNGRGDIVDLHQCNNYGSQDMCWTVVNHSKWKLDYELDFTYYDASGAKLGSEAGTSYDVKPGETNKESQEPTGYGELAVPDGTTKVTLDDVQVVGSECVNSGACDGYQQHPENDNY